MRNTADIELTTEPSLAGGIDALLVSGRKYINRAAILSVAGALIWPIQAALVAFVVGNLLTGSEFSPVLIVFLFVLLGALRAFIEAVAETQSDYASEQIILTLREKIVTVEGNCSGNSAYGGAGSISALASDKLDMLAPYIKRYAPARTRVMIVPLFILALAFFHSWAVGLVLIISGPLIPVFMALIGLAAKEASKRQMAEIGDLNDLLVDRLAALVDIRLLGAQDAVLAAFTTKASNLRERTMAVLRVAFLSSTVLELFAAIGVAMVAVYVGFSFLGVLSFGTWGGDLSATAGIVLLLLAPDFYQPMRDLSAAWHDKAAAEAVSDELGQWANSPSPRILGQGDHAVALQGAASISLQDCILPSGMKLRNFEIYPGESIALMGHSGAGKTSTLRLIAGLQTPSSGTIWVAGQQLSTENADAWRARIGWMPQTPHFLNASLKENITFGQAGDLDLSLSEAGIDQVVGGLQNGLNTRLGETGGGLSGGEARRLTMARAIYRRPDVILADEPTADLDADTAEIVADGLVAQCKRGATLVVATHDFELAKRMDRIIDLGASE